MSARTLISFEFQVNNITVKKSAFIYRTLYFTDKIKSESHTFCLIYQFRFLSAECISRHTCTSPPAQIVTCACAPPRSTTYLTRLIV